MRPVAAILDLSVSHLALGVCRILYHAAVLWLLLDLWTWRGAAFARAPEAAVFLLAAALLVNALLVLGVWAPVLQLVNLPLLRAVFAFCLDPYTVDSVIENFSVVFALAPAPRALALTRRGVADPLAPVPRYFVLLLFTALALLYADGLRYKLASEIWRRGSAVWLGAALPHFSTGLMPQWAEIRWLMAAATYAALVYEALFPLILVRRLRVLWAALGLLVHAGSGMLIALPQFGLLMTGLIAFFVPFERLLPSLPRGDPRSLEPEPRTARGPAVAAYVLIAAMLFGQATLNLYADRPPNLLHRALGLEQRTIFVDWHFVLPTPLIRLAVVTGGKEVALPSFDAQGYPTIHDRYWKTLGFGMRASPRQEAEDFLSRYARDWLRRSGLPPGQLRLYCRDARPTSLGLDFGQDDEQRRRPWRPCGALDLESPPGAR